ncbi:LacI family transcriptional regulator [Oenococcus sicerae]|uniref:LacI family transcriptional regulator n=1 Tax=Oenococcus sicerae TaxID=2203724 RepID=A0ABX5QLY2_9LACO|nr:LacI family DNA-binding transcriptional regulator [Oenococcus sicerae]QAS69796.1 LacI family transcriptional regulator [Oenococcus sicerae]
MSTMKDVAKLAKVSLGTVSRVINHIDGVKAASVDKVQAAVAKLGYVRNDYARGLKINSSQTIALILPTIWNPFFAEFAYCVERELYHLHYKLLLCNSEADASKEYEYIKMVTQNKVDGIIGITYSEIDQYVSSKLPFVSVDRYFTEQVSYVSSENFKGGQIAAAELIKAGAKHLAYFGSYAAYKNETTKRHDGFLEYAKNHCQDVNDIFVPAPIDHSIDSLVNQLFDKDPRVDGIFCVNDTTLIEVEQALNKRGLSVPQDVQLIGYDGIMLTEDVSLSVSTIAQPITKMAKAAVEILLRKIKDPLHKQEIQILPVSFRTGLTTRHS